MRYRKNISFFGVIFCIVLSAIFFYFWTNSESYKKDQAKNLQLEIEKRIQYGKKLGENVQYFKDSRTGLCFGIEKMASGDSSTTNVPCTPEVLELIKKGVR